MDDFIFLLTEKEAKYKQVYQQMKILITQGTLQTNDSLPSIRKLAETLQVSRNTTLTAYEQLVAEGYIRGEGRKGYFVNALEPVFLQEQEQEQPVLSQPTSNTTSLLVDFRAGAVDQTYFPMKTWRQLANQVLQEPSCYQYGELFGDPLLKEQLVPYLLQARGVSTTSENIMIGSSTQQMLLYVGFLLKDHFPSVLLEDPGYNGAREAFQLHRFVIETLPVMETGAQLDILKHCQSRLLYVTPSHHFPYGVSMTIQQRQTLIQWAQQVNGYILEDDYDGEFRYTQQPFPALASIDPSKVIYLGTFSKSFLPGVRLSYMVLPNTLVQPFKERFAHFEQNASSLHQRTMAQFMAQGEWTRHIKRMRLTYKQKMQHLVQELQRQFGPQIAVLGEQSGLYIVVKVKSPLSEQQLIQRAETYGVKVYPTSPFFINQTSEDPLLQLGFSKLTMEEIKLGVERLKEAWQP
ncbi:MULTISPECIES: PLP-dependent aminotransferase family protein [unclassified Lysinibacillus]|uniref:MocR-like pyridoxine biosynthesis transcription factor PdxR n=1 Tax=unclassified Lysinibacillus TaxID=2636778 RepID=UPI000890EA91|nr:MULTISPECIES: PLP-dependent aminotransferase family protein [unclassified Lysinibacillus]WCH49528.1 PLP-dependent aminotransferase family protein [Lysinibacillus sp. OF-1]SCY14045.1 GntR family transcriptional regulator / MocR family aminotransferase [Lysinibacillus sp. SG9]SDB11731.1 GntR family transcriptional regulator / MocR family aminotransferase [Lysinibacillus sp. TC-37]SFS49028.1 GntR family transcriptional regulator / MocR family aminotransferase [Lysinibacillus sp. SG55]